jgi:1-deoxy-D-xylulose-5-phosphate synthase
VAIYSTFIQRAADQVIHDVCLQNLPVIFALDRAGLVSEDGETHQGIYDISLFRSSPNMTILAPAGEEELVKMLQWAVEENSSGPVMIRYPKALCPINDSAFSLPLEKGRGVWIRNSDRSRVCIAFTGSLYQQILSAADILESHGIDIDLYNLRFLKPVDEDFLVSIMNRYEVVLLAEEGCRSGGFGEYAAELNLRRNCSSRLVILGVGESFDALGNREELLHRNGLNGESIAEAAEKALLDKVDSLFEFAGINIVGRTREMDGD